MPANLILEKLFIHEASGSEPILQTARKACAVLAAHGVPCYVAGGLAVQQHGYARFTADVDLVVPDVAAAIDILSIRGFQEIPGNRMTVKDRETKVEVDLLPGGGKVGPALVPYPMPAQVSGEPVIMPLEDLISNKLGVYYGSKTGRLKDLADAQELIRVGRLPSDLVVDERVVLQYRRLWSQTVAG